MRPTLFLLATILLAVATPAAAHWRGPRCRIVAPGLFVQTSGYQDPDGTYESYSYLVRDVNGTPCGIECSRPSRQVIWFASPPRYRCF